MSKEKIFSPGVVLLDLIKIHIASPDLIKSWAERVLPNGQIVGEIIKPDTLNYKTYNPELDGLFCEKIFGPNSTGTCHCGKYFRDYQPGRLCLFCRVELTDYRVRRHRMGYIDLHYPTVHIWYLKGSPSYLTTILDNLAEETNEKITFSKVQNIIYLHDEYDPNPNPTQNNKDFSYHYANQVNDYLSQEKQIVDIMKKKESNENFSGTEKKLYESLDFSWMPIRKLKMGAEIILEDLKSINLKEEIIKMRDLSAKVRGGSYDNLLRVTKRLRLLENFVTTKSRPEWLVLLCMPVLPPSLRPIVEIEAGQFASSDLNDLYRKLIIRNQRLASLYKIYAPAVIIRSEKRLIQESVDSIIDNGRVTNPVKDLSNRPLKSLAENIEGKEGRFRYNLLGKRVDYSGRSIIVVEPKLRLHECGLPFEIAIELFRPFIIRELINLGHANTIRESRKTIYTEYAKVFNLLQNIVKQHLVLLNRAPTLHRLGVQAFQPVIIRTRAIQLHPLVCPAFNADFDGDQMAIHLPLDLEAQLEARYLMFAPYNLMSPSNGEPIVSPTQDMLLGCYYLSLRNKMWNSKAGHYFSSIDDALLAKRSGKINLHTPIWVRIDTSSLTDKLSNSNLENLQEKHELLEKINFKNGHILYRYKDLQVKKDKNGKKISSYIKITPGRLLLSNKLIETIRN